LGIQSNGGLTIGVDAVCVDWESVTMKVGDIALLKENWQVSGVYYGPGVITMMDEGTYIDGDCETEPWKSFRVQWNDDFLWHDPEELELISESR